MHGALGTEIVRKKRAAKAIVIDPDGKILQLRRSKTHPYVPQTPDIPGGTLDVNEDGRDALVRELREEIGIDVSRKKISLFKKMTTCAYDISADVELFEISGFNDRPDIRLSFEHDKYEWVTVDKITETGFFKDLVEEYVASKSA